MTSSDPNSSGARTRRAGFLERQAGVIDAYLDLVLEGDAAPTPAKVAQRAGVSRASVFRYFATLDELRDAAAGQVLERFVHLLELGDPPASRSDRIARFVRSRMRFHDQLHPLALLQRTHAADDPIADQQITASRTLLASQLDTYFRADLDHLSAARRNDVVVTIAVLTSVESWHQSSHSHGRTSAQTRRSWISMIDALLADVAPTPQGELS